MGLNKITCRLCCALLFLCALAAGLCQDTGKDFLLTENGINNPAYSEYKKSPFIKTGGNYYAMPAFAPDFASQYNEKGTVTTPTPFMEGILCNGDSSASYKRNPVPYVYWHKKPFASLFFDLKKQYFISRVRVRILLAPNVHGISKIGVYTWDEMLEAGSQPLKEISRPVNGWNEFVIDKPSDKIKLDFTAADGCAFMTVTEVEIWGRETSSSTGKRAENMENEVRPAVDTAGKSYLAFDFGTVNSPAWDGFTPVSENTVYTKERGYGWVPLSGGKPAVESNYGAGSSTVPGLLSRDRGKEVKVYDDFFRDFCGAQKAYHGQVDQIFEVDIKNGKYIVYLGSGDLVYGAPIEMKTRIDAEGKRVVNAIRYNPDLCSRVQFATEVKDGRLTLRFGSEDEDALNNWNISGILILPANNDKESAAAQKTIAEFERKIAAARESAFSAVYKEVKYQEPNKLFPLSKSDTDRGYILFARDWMKSVYPVTVPQKIEAEKGELSIWCSPGEYEPATFCIYPLANLEAGIEISDLASRSKDRISKDNISIRITDCMPERIKNATKTAGDYTYYISDSSWGTSYMAKVPKILRPYSGKISINETRQVWLTVHVPKTAKPGEYEGTVAFNPVGKPGQTLRLSLTVYPIDLQKSDRLQGMYWHEGTEMYPENRKKELLDMAEHGIRAVVIGKVLPEFKAENGKVTLDFAQMDTLMREIKDAGLGGYMPFATPPLVNRIKYLRKTDALKMPFDDAYAYAVGEIYKHAKESGWPEILFYPVDEIGNSAAKRDLLKQLVPLIRRTPGAKIYCTANNYAAGVECADYIDYWCANIPMSKEQEKDVLSRGKVLMRYGNSYNYNPRISRTVSGFGFWRIPAAAMYYWHYQNINGDPFIALDGISRDHISSYPSPEGPINSVDFEAIREGIDDLNYIYTMQQLMDKAKKSGKGDLAKAGAAILDEITNCDPSYSQYDFAGVPNEKYHEWRLRMAKEIVKLQGVL